VDLKGVRKKISYPGLTLLRTASARGLGMESRIFVIPAFSRFPKRIQNQHAKRLIS
jgi:hypothetical protein